jgi:Flp pilus assembly protein TadB
MGRQQRRGGRGREEEDDDSIERIEQEVLASAQARVDLDSVNRALQEALADDERRKAAVNDQRAISLAAGTASGVLVFVLSHTLFLSIIAFAGVAFLAGRDPTEEDSPAGAVARIVRYVTLLPPDCHVENLAS